MKGIIMARENQDPKETGMPFDSSVLEEQGKRRAGGSNESVAPTPADAGFETDQD